MEIEDFRWLLSEAAKAGEILPELDSLEQECILGAGEASLGLLDRLLLLAVSSGKNAAAMLLNDPRHTYF